jgi:glycyl-tRNA synthetase beta subunit
MHTLEKERQSKISHLNFYLRKLDKEKQIKSNESRRKEIKKNQQESMKLNTEN